VAYGRAVEAMDVSRAAGAQRIGLVTERPAGVTGGAAGRAR
jgi:biopolymer transport protein ExbD